MNTTIRCGDCSRCLSSRDGIEMAAAPHNQFTPCVSGVSLKLTCWRHQGDQSLRDGFVRDADNSAKVI
jgi:hypothetical protein